MHAHPIAPRPQRVADQLGAQCRAADADQKQIGKTGLARRGDLLLVDLLRKGQDAVVGGADRLGDVVGRRQRGIAKPIVADHAVLVRIRDFAGLQPRHRVDGLVEARIHLLPEVIAGPHARWIDANRQLGHVAGLLLIRLPRVGLGHGHSSSVSSGWTISGCRTSVSGS